MILTTTAMCNNCNKLQELDSYFLKWSILADHIQWQCTKCEHINIETIIDVTESWIKQIQGVTK